MSHHVLAALWFVLGTVFSSLSASTLHAQHPPKDFAARVNPFIGTGGHGHTYPGALRPFGMMQLSPDTRLDGWDGCSGYHYSDSIIYGFSHTHLSGTGCSDYGDILIMPTTSDTGLSNYGYSSGFSHRTETAEAGYYKVYLEKPRVYAELTATTRAGMHRYSFAPNRDDTGPAPEQWLVVNLRHRDEVLGARLQQVDSYTLRGYRFSKMWAQNQKVFFEIRFSKPVIATRKGADSLITAFHFKKGGGALLVKVAISAIDEDGAHQNMSAEMPGWDFDGYRKAAHTAWNNELSKLDAKGGTADQQTIFYTALYHSMSAPNIHSDVDNRYRGRDDKIHSTGGKFDYYSVFSLWDTYRAEHPLLTMIDPKRTADFINTFLAQYEQGGALPVWELSSNETYCMIGYHAVPVIWDAFQKRIGGFDERKSYEAMKHSAMLDHFGLESYRKWGFVRSDDEGESVSKTLEYAYDDWCIAQMARALGEEADYAYFIRRSQSWKNVFDPTTGFMRARKNGGLSEGFSPYAIDGNFTEANSWQYSFSVPHDIPGLIAAHGGKKAFEAKLDSLFSARTQTEGREQADVTGLIGQYAHGNEPSHHIAYLYNYVGKPKKTSAVVRQVLDSFYRNSPDGLIGNEDCGQMSAWYVLSAIGFYPVCPGSGLYEAGPTMFDAVYTPTASTGRMVRLEPHSGATDDPAGIHLNPHSGAASDLRDRDLSWRTPADPLIVPNPFIESSRRIFKTSQEIRMGCLENAAQIFYSLNDAPSVRYTAPFTISSNTTMTFYAQLDTVKSYVQEASFFRLPEDRSVVLHSRYDKPYSAGGPDALIDGQHGTTNWRTGGWQGYQGQDFEAVIVLKGAPRKVSGVRASFLEDQNVWVFYPTAVSFYASTDSVNWQLMETIATNKSAHNMAVTTSVFSTSKPVTAQYIKVVAKSFGRMPDWHEGRGEPTFIFVDEIEVK